MERLKSIGVKLLIAVPIWSTTFMTLVMVGNYVELPDSPISICGVNFLSSTITVFILERCCGPWWCVVVGNVAYFISFNMFIFVFENILRFQLGPIGLMLNMSPIEIPYMFEIMQFFDFVVPCALVGSLLYLGGKATVHRLAERH